MQHCSIAVKNLRVSYGKVEALYVAGICFPQGGIFGIMGPNGAGKSTLLKGILGLLPPEEGEVTFFGKAFTDVRKRIAYVPQRGAVDWDFPISVREVVLMGAQPRLRVWQRPSSKEKKQAEAILEEMQLTPLAKRQISELSGGQQQRVFLARALMQEADLYLLDEPFAGVDVSSEKLIIQELRKLRDKGKTAVLVHHDFNTAKGYFDKVLLLNRQPLCFDVPEVALSQKNLLGAFGVET
jgi:manganese/zinc/iron transport system ATP- binding protein